MVQLAITILAQFIAAFSSSEGEWLQDRVEWNLGLWSTFHALGNSKVPYKAMS